MDIEETRNSWNPFMQSIAHPMASAIPIIATALAITEFVCVIDLEWFTIKNGGGREGRSDVNINTSNILPLCLHFATLDMNESGIE